MKTPGQRASQKHEKRWAEMVDGSTVAASGAFWSRKGDVRSDRFLVEHKFTAAASFSVKASAMLKNEREAAMVGRIPLFAVSVGGRDYVVLLEEDFIEIAGLAKDHDTPS